MRYRTTITNKEDNSVGYLDYVWVDSKLISISFTSDELNQTVKYLYNDFDEPVGFVATREDGSVDTFYYLKNAQGDITHIVSAAGKKMVTFTYDVFGKRTVTYQATGSTTPGQIELLTQMRADLLNPFAYRGYCYDYDMGMYYLQSRYYDPNTGRFINADDTNYLDATGTVLGCNLFAYCENDPVNFVDAKGSLSSSVINFVVKYAVYSYPSVGNALTTYYTYKGLIYSAANLYLSKKGYELARRMFNHGMYGYGKSPSKSLKDLAVSRLRNSNIMNKIINNVLRYKSVTNFTKYGTVEFKNNNFVNADLYYSLQHVSYKIVGKKNRGKWYLTITVWDRYDFDNIRSFSGITFGNAANDLGWAMQKIGMMVPYNISVTYSIVSYPIT